MKFASTIVITILVLSVAANVGAATNVDGLIGFGLSPVSGKYSDRYNLGYHAMVGLGINPGPNVQILPKLEYHGFAGKAGAGNQRVFMIGTDLIGILGKPEARVRTMVLGGVGIASLSWSQYDRTSETKVFLEAGAGLLFSVGRSEKFSLTMRFSHIDRGTSSFNFIPISIGLWF